MTTELRNTPQQHRSQVTLAALTDAARVAADTFGYDYFTTADVASIAGRSIGTVYRYFPDRVALLDAIDSGRRVAADVRAERAQQDAKWGEQNHPDGTGPLTAPLLDMLLHLDQPRHEDYCTTAHALADAATRSTDDAAATGNVTWLDITLEEFAEAVAESDPAKLRTELIQLAAVAQQWAEAIDRRAAR